MPVCNASLLVDGKEAFSVILEEISRAKESIRLHMFIWRDDDIGHRIAKALYDAAERGVRVDVTLDRYGMILELAEEGKRSFFHRAPTALERAKLAVLAVLYPMRGSARRWSERENPLREKLLSHPNVTVEKHVFRADHSKYYVIDDRVLIFGGINIEDKENGADRAGRVYQDYMVRIEDAAAVARVLRRMDEGICDPAGEFFANTKRTPVRNFELEAHYLSLLNEAKEEITLTMAYFSPLEIFTDAILAAYRRGVRVTVLIPACANLQNDINQSTVRRLLKKSRGGIRVLLSPKMVHTKLVANEARVSLGSTNINKKAFAQLDELNWCIPNDDSAFCRALWASVRENQALSREVRDYREIRYCRWRAFLESFLV